VSGVCKRYNYKSIGQRTARKQNSQSAVGWPSRCTSGEAQSSAQTGPEVLRREALRTERQGAPPQRVPLPLPLLSNIFCGTTLIFLSFVAICTKSSLAQRKRAGPITQRSEDRNLQLLYFLFLLLKLNTTTSKVLQRQRTLHLQLASWCCLRSFFLLRGVFWFLDPRSKLHVRNQRETT
jgi:hypothetical protein